MFVPCGYPGLGWIKANRKDNRHVQGPPIWTLRASHFHTLMASPLGHQPPDIPLRVWLNTKEGQTAGLGPCFHFPGQPILDFQLFAPHPPRLALGHGRVAGGGRRPQRGPREQRQQLGHAAPGAGAAGAGDGRGAVEADGVLGSASGERGGFFRRVRQTLKENESIWGSPDFLRHKRFVASRVRYIGGLVAKIATGGLLTPSMSSGWTKQYISWICAKVGCGMCNNQTLVIFLKSNQKEVLEPTVVVTCLDKGVAQLCLPGRSIPDLFAPWRQALLANPSNRSRGRRLFHSPSRN